MKLEAKARKVGAKQGQMRQFRGTYIVQVRLHVDQSEGLLEEHNEHSAGDPILIKAVFMHVRLLCKHKRWVLKAYTIAQIKTSQNQPSSCPIRPFTTILAVKKFHFPVLVSFAPHPLTIIHCEKSNTTYLTHVSTNRLWNVFHLPRSLTLLFLCQFYCFKSLFRWFSGCQERVYGL